MARAIDLARRGTGHTWPNPMVGCVVMRDGELLAEGYHHRHGDDHAEVDALRKLDFQAEAACLYVNLEPCCHYGCTPPCTDAIVRSGITRVVVGMLDGNPLVNGKGIKLLEEAGIEVLVGVLEDACRALNEVYAVNLSAPRPFVTLKAAMTADGRLATRTGKSRWITGSAAREHVHRERAAHQAVLVGVGTVLADNPSLTVRLGDLEPPPRNPMRVVLDSSLRTPSDAALLHDDGSPVVICTTQQQLGSERAQALESAGAELVACGAGPRVDLAAALAALSERKVSALLVEGGAGVHGALLDAGCVDRLLLYVAPRIFGGAEALPMALGSGADEPSDGLELTPFAVTRLGDDLLLEARTADGPAAVWWRAQLPTEEAP
jgi:diaminohydroxyphosphoribosylaminopyrimidine deaminase/5-amino-6-(5-phosphoribosylamino)uracil reductase